MSTSYGYTSNQNLDPFQKKKKKWRMAIVLVGCIIASCLLGIWLLDGVIWGKTDGDTPYRTYRYRQASIEPVIASCTKDFYEEPQLWMGIHEGSADVLLISYQRSEPFVDAYYDYYFYAQVEPARLVAGAELVIPSAEVPAVLIETRAPLIYCDTGLEGSIRILEVTSSGTVRAVVDLKRPAPGPEWSYSAEVEFRYPPPR